MTKMTVKDVDVSGKKVLVRADFNVPVNSGNGNITDDSRIQAILPTIRYLLEHEAKVILCSHLGRPDGKVVDKLRLGIVAERLSRYIDQQVAVTRDCIGNEVEKAVNELKDSGVLLLENLRFHPEEEANDENFARALSNLADIYVNDAFSASHRTHASIVGVTCFLPAVAGFLVEREISTLGHLLENPAHPFAALLGGAKVSDKVGMLVNIMDKVDNIIVGGGMAATFLKARGYDTGLSSIETDTLNVAVDIMQKMAESGIKMLLPVDVVVADSINAEAKTSVAYIENILPNARIVDIGPETVRIFSEELTRCQTVFWNGPMGIHEIPQFAEGTRNMVRLIASLKATTIIGGGSTAEIVIEMKMADKMSFISTGGGASLRFLGGRILPGLAAIQDKESGR